MSTLRDELFSLLLATPLEDTHEHLLEEETRLAKEPPHHPECCLRDFSVFFSHYLKDDLLVAGLSPEDLKKFFEPGRSPKDKWDLIKEPYGRARNTGYMQCGRESLNALFGIEDFSGENVEEISKKVAEQIVPGFYRKIIREIANISTCQVHTREDPVFCVSNNRGLLKQDIVVTALAQPSAAALSLLSKKTNKEVRSLSDWHQVIDWCFEQYGEEAVAVKNHGAYSRRLDYEKVGASEVEYQFLQLVKGEDLTAGAQKAIQDHLFHYTVEKAREYALPVKLHTGYVAHINNMRLGEVKQNVEDMTVIFRQYPDVNFVLLHIAYPYCQEVLAAAKHYTNCYTDMCFAWMLDPVTSTQFLEQFLVSVPMHKLCLFGGDFKTVELVPGHARMARKGTAIALSNLIEKGWLRESDVGSIVTTLCQGNARALYRLD